jgi:hypothetical protein
MIEIEAKPQVRHPAIVSGILQAEVRLAPSVLYVKAGTPLRPAPEGWVPADDGLGDMVVATAGLGGDLVHAYRACVLKIFHQHLVAGGSYRVSRVDDRGLVFFERAATGPFLALTDKTILMDMPAAKYHAISSLLLQSMKVVIHESPDPSRVELAE